MDDDDIIRILADPEETASLVDFIEEEICRERDPEMAALYREIAALVAKRVWSTEWDWTAAAPPPPGQ